MVTCLPRRPHFQVFHLLLNIFFDWQGVVEGRQLEAPREIVEAEVSYARLPIVREEFGTVLRDRRWTFALLLCKVLRLYLFVKCFETPRDSRRVVAFSSTLLALHFRKLLRPYAIAGGS